MINIMPRIKVTSFHVVSNHIESFADIPMQKTPIIKVIIPKSLSSFALMILSDTAIIKGLIKIISAKNRKKKK